jgi:chromate reductase, NAD(P)H dehydrogenase (quinone)
MEPRTWNVGVLIGSLRKASFSRKLALALRDNAPSTLRLNVIEIGAMPLYNYDDEPVPPEPWLTFRQQVKAADALLFVTPEYNRSIPSALKNAIDVGSRPKGNSVWDAKPAAVISLSPGVLGAFGANHHLRQSLMCLNVPVMPAPEAYVGGADRLFGDDGSIVVEPTRQFLDQFMRHFAGWIDRFKPAAAA